MRLLVAAVVLFVVSCASIEEQIGRRASFEMDCPADQLEYTELDRHVWGVRGCDQRATYQRQCRATGVVSNGTSHAVLRKCQWIRSH